MLLWSIVTPYVGVWIEIMGNMFGAAAAPVTPYVGVWIEILFQEFPCFGIIVTPYVGVWIEIGGYAKENRFLRVTPYVGVWIEIFCLRPHTPDTLSPPMWGCGLKYGGRNGWGGGDGGPTTQDSL